MKICLLIFFISFALQAQGLLDRIHNPQVKAITGAEFVEFFRAIVPLEIGECTISSVYFSPKGLHFSVKHKREKSYFISMTENSIIKVEHSQGYALLFFYGETDHIYCEINRQGEVVEFHNYYQYSMLEKMIAFVTGEQNSLYSECSANSEVISDQSRSSSKETGSEAGQDGGTRRVLQY